MLVEAGILGGEESLLEALGDVLHGDGSAPGFPEHRHQLAIAGIDVHGLLHLHVAQGLHVRELGGDGVIQATGNRGADQCQDQERDQHPAQPTAKTCHQ
ncbi:hypothetical protein D3C71_1929170 [compost metagenome]